MSKKKKKEEKQPVAYFYEKVDGQYRWWCNQDAGDQFDVFRDEKELQARIAGAKALRIRVFDHLPAFCEDRDCPDCKKYA